MQPGRPSKLLRIHIAESDRFAGKPLYEAIVEKCRELRIAGATVLPGLEGYGESAGLHRAHLLQHDRPVVIAIVDSAENVQRIAGAVEAMMHTGLLAISDVTAIRVTRRAPSH